MPWPSPRGAAGALAGDAGAMVEAVVVVVGSAAVDVGWNTQHVDRNPERPEHLRHRRAGRVTQVEVVEIRIPRTSETFGAVEVGTGYEQRCGVEEVAHRVDVRVDRLEYAGEHSEVTIQARGVLTGEIEAASRQ